MRIHSDTLMIGSLLPVIQVKAGGVGHDASKVKVYGDGVKPTGVLASLPVSFTVDTSQAGIADVDILIEVSRCHFLPRCSYAAAVFL